MKILDLSRNVPEISECTSKGLSPDSTSLPDVNLVDGLPSARHLVQRLSVILTNKCIRLNKTVRGRPNNVSFLLKFVYER